MLLEWYVDGTPCRDRNWTQARTLHYVAKVDLSLRRLLFLEDFAIIHRANSNITVKACMGSWDAFGVETFSLLSDPTRAELAADRLLPFIAFDNVLERLMDPHLFANIRAHAGKSLRLLSRTWRWQNQSLDAGSPRSYSKC